MFELEPRFIELDNRKNRKVYQITEELLEKKHLATLPKELVNGKTVLDLGSCLGATGFWCLNNAAAHYTGIEIQKEYCDLSNDILNGHFSSDKFEILNQDINEHLSNTEQLYDIVIAAGIIYSFIDVFDILKKICDVCKDILVIESHYPINIKHPTDSLISLRHTTGMNLANKDAIVVGLGSIPSPEAIKKICANNRFVEGRGLIYPEKVEKSFDVYNTPIKMLDNNFPRRFILELKRSDIKLETCTEKLINNTVDDVVSYDEINEKMMPLFLDERAKWTFNDEDVAIHFQQIAKTNIPNYETVIGKCIDIANKYVPKTAKILDIGSSLNHTLKRFYDDGFNELFGVEYSDVMIKHKENIPATIIKSDKFPSDAGPFDFIMANWVLHFILDRKTYIKDIYENLEDGGILILSEKMTTDDNILNLYHDFKRQSGLTEKEIIDKHSKIQGVLITYPLEWYIDTLKDIGFRNISCIDAHFCFTTLFAQK